MKPFNNEMRQVPHERRHQEWVSAAAAAMLLYWVNVFTFDGMHGLPNLLAKGVAYSTTLIVMLAGIHRIHYSHILLIALTGAVALASTFAPAGDAFLKEGLYAFLIAGSMGVLMVSVIREPRWIIIWWGLYAVLIALASMRAFMIQGDGSLYMSTSYNLFNVFIWVLLMALRWRRWYYYALLGAILVALVFMGTRGALASVVLAVLISVAFAVRSHAKVSRLISGLVKFGLVGLTAMALYFFLFEETGARTLGSIGGFIGVKSRTSAMIANKRLDRVDDRIGLYTKILDSFHDGRLLGSGLGGDAYILESREAYAHNLFLELLADFGILSFVLLGLLILLINRSLLRTRDSEWKMAGLLFCFAMFLPRLFSSTLLHPLTLPTIGLLLQIKRSVDASTRETVRPTRGPVPELVQSHPGNLDNSALSQ